MDVSTQRFFNQISTDQINKKLAYLKKNLPKKSTKSNYQLTNSQLSIQKTTINLQENLQKVADRMREHLGIQRFIKIITIPNIEAGKFERIGDLNCIYINATLYNQTYEQKIAILAHEMSHYFLIYKHGILLPNTNENELLTDLNAIYIGFGFLLLDGYGTVEKRRDNTIFRSKVGYIQLPTVKETIVKTAYLRRQNPMWILKKTDFFQQFYFGFKLLPLIRDYYKAKRKQ